VSKAAPPRRPVRWAVLTVAVVAALAGVLIGAPGLLPDRAPEEAPSPAAAAVDAVPPTPTSGASAAPVVPETPAPTRPPKPDRDPEDRTEQPVDQAAKALAERVEALLDEQELVPAGFRVASYNVLGASHTSAGGNKPWYPSGAGRMVTVVDQLGRLDVDVVGFQEYEPVQHRAFMRLTAGRFGAFPGAEKGRNSIAWRKDTWRLVSAHTIAIPYFRGKPAKMPYVLLEHVETGRAVYFINVHNPASSRKRGDNERWRDVATARQSTLANRLRERTGFPVVLTGDFNEREEAFCSVTSQTGMNAANGGSNDGACRPPAVSRIDWIFGSPELTFSGFRRLESAASDHPLIYADAQAD
jgi:endonuclease/exonuclease/phosphatase family metal-dependent hydrolase